MIKNYSTDKIYKELQKVGYFPTKQISFAVSAAINNGMPVLVEGEPGAGKTFLAKSTAAMLGLPLLRVQFYEGLTADKILYDYDYQKQLLTIESIKTALENNLLGKSINEAIELAKDIDFYGKDFLIRRPILEALSGEQQYVLLLDEVDKSSEEIEYTLLETLDEFSITIPQLGTITCPKDKRPIVFLTSNNYRELSDALKRRCAYLYIPKKTESEMFEILKQEASASETLAKGIAACMNKINHLNLKQNPSIAEAKNWMSYILSMEEDADIDLSLCMLVKNEDDRDKIIISGALDELR